MKQRGFGFVVGCSLIFAAALGCKSIPYLNFTYDLVLEVSTPDELDELFVIVSDDQRLGSADRKDLVEVTLKDELDEAHFWAQFLVNRSTGLLDRADGSRIDQAISIEVDEDAPVLELAIDRDLLADARLERASLMIVAGYSGEYAGWKITSREMNDTEETTRLYVEGLVIREAYP